MKFGLIKNQSKLEKLRQHLRDKYPYSLERFGKIVAYEMPALPQPFPRLREVLENGTYPRNFWGVEYYLATNGGYIDSIIPAAEYYKFGFRAVADKFYSLGLSVEVIERLVQEIKSIYRAERSEVTRTSQPFFAIHNQIYSLKGELGNLLFTSRSIMDSIATLMHFLYGPNSAQFSSFADFVKYISKSHEKTGAITDDIMRQFVENKLEWFSRLRDIRDYITHFKSIGISFFEQTDGEINVHLEDRLEVNEFVWSVKRGITEFMNFMDGHFSERLTGET